MQALARRFSSPGLAAIVALPMLWSMAATAPAQESRAARPAPQTIAGTWSFLFGTFQFHPVHHGHGHGHKTFTDTVLTQRLGVFCRQVNDQDGQIVVHRVASGVYTGTWQWFSPQTCQPAGTGQITITLWRHKPEAFVVSDPPVGARGISFTFRIQHLSWPVTSRPGTAGTSGRPGRHPVSSRKTHQKAHKRQHSTR
jgi:hypothetical protein